MTQNNQEYATRSQSHIIIHMIKTDYNCFCCYKWKFNNCLCRSFFWTPIQMVLLHSLAESPKPLLYHYHSSNAGTQSFHSSFPLRMQHELRLTVKPSGNPPETDGELSKLTGTHTLPLRRALCIREQNKRAHPPHPPPLVRLPSTWLKTHHPQTKWKKKKEDREVGRENRGYLWLPLFSVGSSSSRGRNSGEQRTWESVTMWICLRGCVITSDDMFPPLPL